ncbi:MAG: hypothetical protein ACM3ZE_16135 [Myxococcales bacterium]
MSCEDESSRARAMSKEAFAAEPSVAVEPRTASDRMQAEIDARARQKSEEDAAKTERLRKVGPAARLSEAKLFADGCISANTCDSVVAARLVASSANQKDGSLISSIVGATSAGMAVKQATDGTELSAAVVDKATEPLLANGKAGLRHLPTCTRGAAMKDPASSRGKIVTASGQVVQIQRDGPVFVGTLMSDGLKAIYFVTPFETDKIEEGSYATFRGLFVQQFYYANAMGGQTEAAALLGAFD